MRTGAERTLQGVSEPLHDAADRALPDHGVDVVLSSGVVGHHFDVAAVARLAVELRRVLRPDGAAVLDAGPRVRARQLTRLLTDAGFVRVAMQRLAPFNTRAQLVFRRA
jgi:hypothetical protein